MPQSVLIDAVLGHIADGHFEYPASLNLGKVEIRAACVNGHRSRTFAHFCDPPSDHIIPVSFVVSRSETPQIESENHGRGALLCATFWVSSHFRAARNGTREIQILLRK